VYGMWIVFVFIFLIINCNYNLKWGVTVTVWKLF